MQIKECIILAGGLGTRLRTEVANLPKCMAPVAGKPFIHWVLIYLQLQKVTSFVLSLGYMHEVIEEYIGEYFPDLSVKFSVEKEPLGTGGAIHLAMKLCKEEHILVANGDTLFETNNENLLTHHLAKKSDCTIALKPIENFDRYGVVKIDSRNSIISFEEKKYQQRGLINGGVYLINKSSFNKIIFPEKFSFEKDFLEKFVQKITMVGIEDHGYFIDIGIPEDFKKANLEIKEKYNV
ncbi:MAG: nucleotidyltransferase family protein [Ferruginibacter sp.]